MPVKKNTTKNKKTTSKKKIVKQKTKKFPVKKSPIKKAAVRKASAKKVATKKLKSKKLVKAKKSKKLSQKTAKIVKKMPTIKMPVFISKIETQKLSLVLIILLAVTFLYFVKNELIVARVNGRAISRFALIKNLEKQGASQVLEDMTLKILIEQKIKEAGVKIEQSEIDDEVQKVSDMLEAQGQSLEDLLDAQGLTLAEVEEQLKLTKGMEALLADRVDVTDGEVETYFEDNKELLGEGADLEGMREQIQEQLRQQKFAVEQQVWLEEIKSESNIKYFKFEPVNNLNLY